MGEVDHQARYHYTKRNHRIHSHVHISTFYVQVLVFIGYKQVSRDGINSDTNCRNPGHRSALYHLGIEEANNSLISDHTYRSKQYHRVKNGHQYGRTLVAVSVGTV